MLREPLFSRWGLLPVALVFAWTISVCLGALVFGGARPRDRVIGGAIFALGLFSLGVRLLGAVGLLATAPLFVSLLVVTAGLVALTWRRARRAPWRALEVPWRSAIAAETTPLLIVAAAALTLAFAAAYLLPVWQWDSLGYHLPYVDFALQSGSLAGVPRDVPYLSTYPHATEHLFIALRAMLPDDRLVDLAQIPFGLLGVAAIAAIARRGGATPALATCAGLAWLTLPAVFLQLPTNYVDVAAAAFLLVAVYFGLGEPSSRNLAAAGVALGLFLGTKPNAPMGTAIFGLFLVVIALRARAYRGLAFAVVALLALGAESYVDNLVRHHNPIWPVQVDLGPIHLPGTEPMQKLLGSGAAAPRAHGGLILRTLHSWSTVGGLPAFDMRLGGLGPVFLASIPLAALSVARRRGEALVGALAAFAAALASPDPSVARYVLAVPALSLAFAAPALGRAAPLPRAAALGVASLTAALLLVRAADGLTGEGPALLSYLSMPEQERAIAVGADGPPWPIVHAVERLEPGEIAVFDTTFDLPHLAWPSDLSSHARRVPDQPTEDDIRGFLHDQRIKLFFVDRGSDLALAAIASGDFDHLFHCKSSRCSALLRN